MITDRKYICEETFTIPAKIGWKVASASVLSTDLHAEVPVRVRYTREDGGFQPLLEGMTTPPLIPEPFRLMLYPNQQNPLGPFLKYLWECGKLDPVAILVAPGVIQRLTPDSTGLASLDTLLVPPGAHSIPYYKYLSMITGQSITLETNRHMIAGSGVAICPAPVWFPLQPPIYAVLEVV